MADILADVEAAVTTRDAVALSTLAAELTAHGTRETEAQAAWARGVASTVSHDYPASLEHHGRALALFMELGDHRSTARMSSALGSMHASMGQYADALEYLQRALSTYTDLADRDGIAVVTGNIGLVYDSMGDFPRAMQQLHRSLEMHTDLDDRYNMARVSSNLGNVYWSTGNYPEALALLRRALAIHEEDGNRRGIAIVTGNIGNIYHSTGDHAQALNHYRRALTMHEAHADIAHAARITANMGLVHAMMHAYDEALALHRRARALHQQIGDRAGVSTVSGNIILALLELGRDEEAAQLLEEQAAMLMDDPETRVIHLSNRATLAERHGDLDAALAALQHALALSSEAGIRADEALCHERLRDLAQKRNDFAAYIEHNNEFTRITEEVRGKEATQRMTMMEAERKVEGERRERAKERSLLYGALPKHVADRMISGESVSGDHFDHAAVVFIDVAGFTTQTATMAPADVVTLLDHIFKVFDEICDATGVMKVKTIGDSYMCFRGDADATTNAVSVATFAIHALRTTFTWPTGEPVRFRVGAHIGPVAAGVIGTQRLQYDVWGDTVNVASRMESSGEAGRIHISEAMALNLKRNTEYTIQNSIAESSNPESHSVSHEVSHNVSHSVSHSVSHEVSHEVSHSVSHKVSSSLVTIERGEIEVKGKGPMITYWLLPCLLFIALMLPTASSRASWPFGEPRQRQDWRVGIAPGLAFPVTASGGLERTITWAIDAGWRVPRSPVLVIGGYRYINVVKDISSSLGGPMTSYQYEPYEAVSAGLELELADQRRTLLPSARLAFGYPILTNGAFTMETGLLADLYVLDGGSITLEVSMVTRFDAVHVMSIPVRLGLRWGW
ncbi:MAG: tetratricopeptide repeat protein [Bacteroidetes bacterium]|nr:tetratricopeptide repeat protein [Bacteroidota bacterium]